MHAQMQDAINKNLREATIRVVTPGIPKERSWMNFAPGDNNPIKNVCSWAVINTNQIAVQQAIVD